MRVKRGEADGGGGKSSSAQDGSTEIETRVKESSRWSEIVGLLGLWKYIRDIVALIAPGVPIDRSKEDAIGTVKDEAEPVDLASKPEARGKIVLIGIEKSARIIVLAADEDRRYAVVKDEVCVGVPVIIERAGILVAKTDVEGGGGVYLPGVLDKCISAPILEVHLGHAGLALLDGGKTEEKAGESGTGAVIESLVGRVAICELIIPAVLKETPHRPPVTVEIAADFYAMTAMLPSEGVAEFQHGVPSMHGSGGKSVADAGVTLNRKPGSAPSAGSSEADALKAKLGDVVIDVVVLRSVVHREARYRDREGIDFSRG